MIGTVQKYTPKEGENIWVCADIHGERRHLEKAIQIVNGQPLFILGDVVDRGRFSVECLRLCFENPNIHLCLGNHELYWITEHILEERITNPELQEYVRRLPLVFRIEVSGHDYFLTHAYQPKEILYAEESLLLDGTGIIDESDYTVYHRWDTPYTLITGHFPTSIHPYYHSKTKERQHGEVLRFGSRIFIDAGTPTSGILPIYNLTHDYEITIYDAKVSQLWMSRKTNKSLKLLKEYK